MAIHGSNDQFIYILPNYFVLMQKLALKWFYLMIESAHYLSNHGFNSDTYYKYGKCI